MPRPGMEFDRGFHDDQWYGGPRNYQDGRECHNDEGYPPSDRRYFDDNPNYRRVSPPPRNVRQNRQSVFLNKYMFLYTESDSSFTYIVYLCGVRRVARNEENSKNKTKTAE